jgi:uncharacterized protein YidB (DUF937 family)
MALLHEIFGGGNQQPSEDPSTMQKAVLGALAYHTVKDQGGLDNISGSDAGAAAQQNAAAPQVDSSTQQSGFFGWVSSEIGGLTGLLSRASGGAAGPAISDGLQNLLNRFRQNGLSEKIESWISSSPNKSISPGEMEQGLGSDMVNWLTRETGMAKNELLAGLSKYLPEAVDKLTPNGKVPSAQEAQQHVNQQQTH